MFGVARYSNSCGRAIDCGTQTSISECSIRPEVLYDLYEALIWDPKVVTAVEQCESCAGWREETIGILDMFSNTTEQNKHTASSEYVFFSKIACEIFPNIETRVDQKN